MRCGKQTWIHVREKTRLQILPVSYTSLFIWYHNCRFVEVSGKCQTDLGFEREPETEGEKEGKLEFLSDFERARKQVLDRSQVPSKKSILEKWWLVWLLLLGSAWPLYTWLNHLLMTIWYAHFPPLGLNAFIFHTLMYFWRIFVLQKLWYPL